MAQDFYNTLGVQRGASDDEIKKAYRKLARQYHPDVNPDDDSAEAKFKEISEAYSVLSDPDKRSRYDEYGADGIKEGFDAKAYEDLKNMFRGGNGGFRFNFGGGGPSAFGGGGPEGFDLGDLFGMGGFSPRARGSAKGRDVQLQLRASFEQAYTGFSTKFTYARPMACGACNGRGAVGNNLCTSCGGRGVIEKSKTLTVNVPKGAATGDTIRLRGKGGQGRQGAPDGDLILEIVVADHPEFERDGINLTTLVTISALDALLGTRVEVPTVDGSVRMTVPAGIASGQKLRVSGKGMERGKKTGDLYVELRIDASLDDLSGEAGELIAKIGELRQTE